MTEEPEIRELAPQRALVQYETAEDDGVPAAVHRAFPALFKRLESLGAEPAAAPYIRYLETGPQMSLEFGIPLADSADPGDLPVGELPGGRVAVLRHLGPFEGLRAACDELAEWVAKSDEQPVGPFWEAYLTDPSTEPDSTKWVTEVCQPLR